MTYTDYVRESYAYSGEGLDFKRVAYERMDEFDSWLNKIKAEAWDEGFTLATRNNPNHPHYMAKMNPYRTED